MTKIKLIDEETTYLSIEKTFNLEINGKKVKLIVWGKDMGTMEYDGGDNIEDIKELTEEEADDLIDFSNALSLTTTNKK